MKRLKAKCKYLKVPHHILARLYTKSFILSFKMFLPSRPKFQPFSLTCPPSFVFPPPQAFLNPKKILHCTSSLPLIPPSICPRLTDVSKLQTNPYQITLQLMFKLRNKTPKVSAQAVLPRRWDCRISCIHASRGCGHMLVVRTIMSHANCVKKTGRQTREGKKKKGGKLKAREAYKSEP